MIRYPITHDELLRKINSANGNWLNRAQLRTNQFRRLRSYTESSTIWHEVKLVYLGLQHGKCAYCERKLGTDDLVSVEIHMDHFRPKSCVKYWPPPNIANELGLSYTFSTGPDSPNLGYFLLVYHPWNFAAACGTCNTRLKADFFPIAASVRQLDGDDPWQMTHERPLIVYPIGSFDEDPETLITFAGYVPTPTSGDGLAYQRARVTIDFFRLGPGQGRDDLVTDRAILIRLLHYLYGRMSVLSETSNEGRAVRVQLEGLMSPCSPHTNCVRSFLRLCGDDPAMALEVYDSCCKYLESHGL